MSTATLNGSLMFFTLIAVLLIAVVLLLRFLRKPENRHPMRGQEERTVDQMRDEAGDRRF